MTERKAAKGGDTTHPLADDPHGTRAAYEKWLPKAQALREEDLEVFNADLVEATDIAMQAHPAIMALLPEIRRELPNFDPANATALGEIAAAGYYVATRDRQGRDDVGTEIANLVNEGVPLRNSLEASARAISVEFPKLINPKDLEAITHDDRPHVLAGTLTKLGGLFYESWDGIKDHTPLTPARVSRAAEIGNSLRVKCIERDMPVRPEGSPARERAQFWTLLVHAYGECVDAIAWVRRKQGDAATVTPPLRPGPGAPKKRTQPQSQGTTPVAAPSLSAPKGTDTPVDAIGDKSGPYVK